MYNLKPCPWRIHGARTPSLTIAGEYFYSEVFMPCLGEECPAFNPASNTCMKDGANFDMNRRASND